MDILTYDWTRDEELRAFHEEREEGVRYLYYVHASPPCGPYSSMANHCRSPLSQRNLKLDGLQVRSSRLGAGKRRAEADDARAEDGD